MISQILAAMTVAFFIYMTFTSASWAAHRKPDRVLPTKTKAEIYSATEEGTLGVPMDEGAPEDVPVPAHVERKAKKKSRVKKAASPAPSVPAQSAPLPVPPLAPELAKRSPVGPSNAFDRVPAGQADSIAGRLRLVELLIREHGRAYDYRTLTTHQLQAILQQLDAAEPGRRHLPPPPPELLPPELVSSASS